MTGSGGDYLTRKSEALRRHAGAVALVDVLIVDDDALDADRLLGTLRIICGYDVSLRRAANIKSALTLVMAKQPDMVLLDDILKPSDDAAHTIPLLRRAGYIGPIIVISGQATRKRKATLLTIGATDVIHKDDVDSVRLTEALQRAFPRSPAT
jgi:CheY-like chemotaxis protein